MKPLSPLPCQLRFSALATALLALVLLTLPAGAAKAEVGPFGLDAGFGALWTQSDSVNPIVSERALPVGILDARLQLDERFGVQLGFRTLSDDSVRDDGLQRSLTSYAVNAAGTFRHRLVWHLYVVAELALEAQTMELAITTANQRLNQWAWAFAVRPQAGLELAIPLGRVVKLNLRLQAGYAFHTDLNYDHLTPTSTPNGDVASVRPLDVGSANLSGATFGFTAGVAF